MNRLSAAIRDLKSGLALLRRDAASLAAIWLASMAGLAATGFAAGAQAPVLLLAGWLTLSLAARQQVPAPSRQGAFAPSLRGLAACLWSGLYGLVLAVLTLMVVTVALAFPLGVAFGLPGMPLRWPEGLTVLAAVQWNAQQSGTVIGVLAGLLVLVAIPIQLGALAKFLPVAAVAVRDRIPYAAARQALEASGAPTGWRLFGAFALAGGPALVLAIAVGGLGPVVQDIAFAIVNTTLAMLLATTTVAVVAPLCPARSGEAPHTGAA